MRTTLAIDDDIYTIARQIAAFKHIAIGTAISELARRGLNQRTTYATDSDFPMFSVSDAALPFGLADTKSDEDEA